MQKIFIFGDSIAYGAWDAQGGWAERLRQWFFATTREDYNLGTFLYNLSIVGDTTTDLLQRFLPEMEARQAGDLIVFAAGINDAQYIHGRPIATPADVCSNVRTLIRRARAFAPLLCWVGPTPVDESRTMPIPWMSDRAYRNAAVALFNAAIQQTAAEEGVEFLDLFTVWSAEQRLPQLLFDGIHPNSAGHAWLCEQLKAFLQSRGLLAYS
ncbi:MAG: SGNH/GDSL hydrolase family protein [Candidatus Tectimicrobiota bacterium]